MSDTERIQGTVERITFRNEHNGWTVLDVDIHGELHKVVGILPLCCVGEQATFEGKWGHHATFGPQFEATAYSRRQPVGADAVLRYLAAGSVKGIGPATAAAIVDRFGEDSLRILEEEPLKLAQIRGISLKKAHKIGEDYAAQFGLREVMLTFSQYGLTPNEALRCWKRWGAGTLERVKNDPYVLCASGLRIGFERADALCMAMNGDPRSRSRIAAGIQYVLRHNLQNGHTCLPRDKLLPTAASMLEVDISLTEDVLDDMIASGNLHVQDIHARAFLALPHVWNAESNVAARLKRMAYSTAMQEEMPPNVVDTRIDKLEKQSGIRYATRQRDAIRAALGRELLVITGGPGTGKTTTLNAIIQILESVGKQVVIGAPTGRAAKRMEELTGHEAKTLHRLLEVQWDEDDTAVFARNEQNPLHADVVVIDEMSMVDIFLCDSLLCALKAGCRLILVGDTDQLPAVGAGCVLHDILQNDHIPSVHLTDIFRQAQQSRIVTNAHRIVHGELPSLSNQGDTDCFFMPRNSEQSVADTVVELCTTRIPAKYPHTVFAGLQVLCPARKGALGTRALNVQLQDTINPPADNKAEITVEGGMRLRVGDKVMHTRNNYDIVWTRDDDEVGTGVFNGDIGILESVNRREETLRVRYDDRVALYTYDDANDLELAYATTVHKSQGSEFEAVILPLYHTMPLLCYRNLLYTAVTRAKSLLIIVGAQETVEQMVQNDRKQKRYSALWYLLQEKGV